MRAQTRENLDDGIFTILEHLEANLTDKQSVQRIAEYFCRISQEYLALNTLNLTETVQNKLKNRLKSKLPFVSKYKVQNMIKKAKKTKSGVPGDLPKNLTKEFGQELAEPLCIIYQNIIQTGQWPDTWRFNMACH